MVVGVDINSGGGGAGKPGIRQQIDFGGCLLFGNRFEYIAKGK